MRGSRRGVNTCIHTRVYSIFMSLELAHPIEEHLPMPLNGTTNLYEKLVQL